VRLLKLFIPCLLRESTRCGFKATGLGLFNQAAVTIPPRIIPVAKNRFHVSFFQLYLKKDILEGKHAAHICLKVEEIPNDLFPKINNNGTVNPIRGPATYHGQGACNHSASDMARF
jgi:hypothetical protein